MGVPKKGAKKSAAAAVKASDANGAGKAKGKAKASAASQSATAAAAADVLAEVERERRQAEAGPSSAIAATGVDGENVPQGAKNKAAETTAYLRSIGEHVDTRRTGEDMEIDEEGVGADIYDELGEDDGGDVDTAFKPLAAAIPAAAIEQEAVRTATSHNDLGNALFVGHNRNSVTAVAARGDALVYGDKLGVVTKVTINAKGEQARREMLLPHVDQPVTAVALSDTSGAFRKNTGLTRTTADLSVDSYVAVGTSKGLVRIWNLDTLEHVGDLTLHRAAVNGLTFRMNTSVLVSVSSDKVVRAWSVSSMSPLDRYFGHQAGINAVSALRAERAVSVGDDRVPRLWKLDRATQTAFATLTSPCDAVTLIDDNTFVVGCRSGMLCVFDTMKRGPVWRQEFAHGYGWGGDGTGMERQYRTAEERFGSDQPPAEGAHEAFGNGITALASIPFSDLVASGSYDGFVRLWRFRTPEVDPEVKFKSLELVAKVPVFGFVNSLTFARDGREIVAGIGKEPRGGRWMVQRAARNGLQRIPLSATGAPPRRSTVKEATLPVPNPAEDLASMARLAKEAMQPTQREVMLQERKAKKAKAAAALAAKAARKQGAAASDAASSPKAIGTSPKLSPKQSPRLVAPTPPQQPAEPEAPPKKLKKAVAGKKAAAAPAAAAGKKKKAAKSALDKL